MRIEKSGDFLKVDDGTAGIAYGWAIVCTENDAEYTDLQGDHIPESVMVDAAVDFALNSRVGKDMHAGDKVGDVFVYPITKGSASGLGISTTKTGLLIGFRPHDPALLELIKTGARAGFSIGGTLTESDASKAFAKSAASPAGPKRTFRSFKIHEISLVDRPAQEGATVGYVKSAPLVIAQVPDEESLAAAEAARVAASIIDPLTPAPETVITPEPSMTTEADKTIADLTAKLAKAERLTSMTDAQRAHYGKLGADGEAYLAKSFADRESVLVEIAKADEVVYTSKSTGDTFRKSDDPRLVKMAKDSDKLAEDIAKRDETIEKAEIATLAKSTLGNLGGSDEVHQLIVKSLRKSGAPQVEIDAALTAMAGWHVLAKSAATAKGYGGTDPQPDSLESKLELVAKGIATEQKVDIRKARALALDTDEGATLYGEIEKRKQAARAGVSA